MNTNITDIISKWQRIYSLLSVNSTSKLKRKYTHINKAESLTRITIKSSNYLEIVFNTIYNLNLLNHANDLQINTINNITTKIDSLIEYVPKVFRYYDITFLIKEVLDILTEIANKNNLNIDTLKQYIDNLKRDIDGTRKTIFELFEKIKYYQKNNLDIEKFLEETSLQKQALEDALNQVHGKKNEQGEREGGLINELKTRSKDIQTEYEKVKAVGLAGAYSAELKDLKDTTWYYNIAFYGSLIVIPIIMFIIYVRIETIPLESFSKFGNITPVVANIAFIITNFLIKLPFILPFIWLSIFLAKRRAETVRLKQEYTHKLTVAKTYISYNEQIKNLNQSDQDKLSALLLENMIQMIYHNPATTLDKQQRSDSPLEEMYNRLNKEHTYMEKIKEFFVKKDEKAESAKDEK